MDETHLHVPFSVGKIRSGDDQYWSIARSITRSTLFQKQLLFPFLQTNALPRLSVSPMQLRNGRHIPGSRAPQVLPLVGLHRRRDRRRPRDIRHHAVTAHRPRHGQHRRRGIPVEALPTIIDTIIRRKFRSEPRHGFGLDRHRGELGLEEARVARVPQGRDVVRRRRRVVRAAWAPVLWRRRLGHVRVGRRRLIRRLSLSGWLLRAPPPVASHEHEREEREDPCGERCHADADPRLCALGQPRVSGGCCCARGGRRGGGVRPRHRRRLPVACG